MSPHVLSRALLLLAALALLAGAPAAQTTWYVDQDAVAGLGDGSSWSDAFLALQPALVVASPGDTLRVAEGVHTPGVLRTDAFPVPPGVGIFGGYAGHGEPNPDARDPAQYPTVLSGDLLGDDLPDFGNRGDNAFHVVVIPPIGGLPVQLDGLGVRGGQADGDFALGQLFGGGVYAADGAHLTLRDCTLTDNFAGAYGGGLYAHTSVVDMRRCDVVGNLVDHDVAPATSLNTGGGGVYTESSNTTLFGCLFQDNACVMGAQPGTGFGAGAAGLELAVAAHVTHCRFVGNTASALDFREGRGGALGMLLDGGLGVLAECVFEDNLLDVPGGDEGDAGGGAWVNGAARIVSCRFLGNGCTGFGGGLAAVNQNAIALTTVENCEFSGNLAAYAAGLYVINVAPLPIWVVGCTVSENHATFLIGGVQGFGATELSNSILWGNTDIDGGGQSAQVDALFGPQPGVTYCDVEGWSSGGAGNLALDPWLADPLGPDGLAGNEDDDLRLLPGSPCIDAGNDAAQVSDLGDIDRDGDTTEKTPVDGGGLEREADDPLTPDTGNGTAPIVDMGAHEFGSALPDERWSTLGFGLAGTHGEPQLVGRGTLCAFTDYELELTNMLELTSAYLVLGVTPIFAAFKGGTLVPAPDIVIAGLPTGPLGELTLTLPWLDEEYPGLSIWWQVWIPDPGGPLGWAASNAVLGTTPVP